MPALRIDLSYDGTEFHGYAKQPDVRTVQAELESALAKVLGEVDTVVAGRTDAGVHARHQVVSLAWPQPVDLERLQRALLKLLPPDITVNRISAVDDQFSARFSATSRTYRYQVSTAPAPDPFERRTHWQVSEPLDAFAMNQGARHLVGEHDFASFCRRAEGRSTTRTVLAANWTEPQPDVLVFEIRGLAFCHQMVRSIVAALVDVGRGKLDPGDIRRILFAEDRNAARGAAPPHGLFLWEIEY